MRIDRTEYEWQEEKITGAQLRRLPTPPIPPERFFTAPNTINPGTHHTSHVTA